MFVRMYLRTYVRMYVRIWTFMDVYVCRKSGCNMQEVPWKRARAARAEACSTLQLVYRRPTGPTGALGKVTKGKVAECTSQPSPHVCTSLSHSNFTIFAWGKAAMTPLGDTMEKEKANTIINKGTKDYQEDWSQRTKINWHQQKMQQGWRSLKKKARKQTPDIQWTGHPTATAKWWSNWGRTP